MIKFKLSLRLAEIGMTKKEISEITGISKNTIGSYCNGGFQKIDKIHLALLCKFFKCGLDDMIYISEEESLEIPSSNEKRKQELIKSYNKLKGGKIF